MVKLLVVVTFRLPVRMNLNVPFVSVSQLFVGVEKVAPETSTVNVVLWEEPLSTVTFRKVVFPVPVREELEAPSNVTSQELPLLKFTVPLLFKLPESASVLLVVPPICTSKVAPEDTVRVLST